MNKKNKFLILFLILFVLITPFIVHGWDGLVPCGGVAMNTGTCDFKALMTLINKVINFALFDLAIPIAAIMFAYAGFLLITAGGGEAKTRAKNIFMSAAVGMICAAAAWIIINAVLSILGYDGSWIGL